MVGLGQPTHIPGSTHSTKIYLLQNQKEKKGEKKTKEGKLACGYFNDTERERQLEGEREKEK